MSVKTALLNAVGHQIEYVRESIFDILNGQIANLKSTDTYEVDSEIKVLRDLLELRENIINGKPLNTSILAQVVSQCLDME